MLPLQIPLTIGFGGVGVNIDQPDPPSFTVDPVVTGGTDIGDLQTTDDGTIVGEEPITVSRQWFDAATLEGEVLTLDGRPLGFALEGETATTKALEVGKQIFCTTYAENDYGSAEADSNVVSPPSFTLADLPGLLVGGDVRDATVDGSDHLTVMPDLAGNFTYEVVGTLTVDPDGLGTGVPAIDNFGQETAVIQTIRADPVEIGVTTLASAFYIGTLEGGIDAYERILSYWAGTSGNADFADADSWAILTRHVGNQAIQTYNNGPEAHANVTYGTPFCAVMIRNGVTLDLYINNVLVDSDPCTNSFGAHPGNGQFAILNMANIDSKGSNGGGGLGGTQTRVRVKAAAWGLAGGVAWDETTRSALWAIAQAEFNITE